MSGSILLLAFKRADILRETVLALEQADRPGIEELIAVVQGDDAEVHEVIKNINWISCKVINTRYSSEISSKEAINRNLHLGLSEVFKNNKNDFAVVIEDDICVSKDFLKFIDFVFYQNVEDKFFRAINGFSGIPRAATQVSNFGKYRYGVGWGWALPRRTWDELNHFWVGDEDEHWDGLIESFMKTGFTISPGMSRIRNIGFGEGATHTNGATDSSILLTQEKIENSFVDLGELSALNCEFNLVESELNWRDDCRLFSYPIDFRSKTVQGLYIFIHKLQRLSLRHPIIELPLQKAIAIVRKVSNRLD